MRLRILLPFVLLSLPLASMHAAAQTSAAGKVTIADLPPGPSSLTAGQSMSVPFKVNVAASGFTCTSGVKLTIDLALTNANAAPAGVTASVDPANLSIDIAPGSYQDTSSLPAPLPVGPLNASGAATLKVNTRVDAAGGNFPMSVSASSKGALGTGTECVPATITFTSDTKNHAVNINAGSSGGNNSGGGPGPIGGGNNTGGNNTGTPPPPPAKSPGFETLAAAGGIAVVALLARRKR